MSFRLPRVSYKLFLTVTVAIGVVYLWWTSGSGLRRNTLYKSLQSYLRDSEYHAGNEDFIGTEEVDNEVLCRKPVWKTSSESILSKYFSKQANKCKHQRKIEYCSFQSVGSKQYQVNCSLKNCPYKIHLSYFHMERGVVPLRTIPFDKVNLTIYNIAYKEKHSGYVFIICDSWESHLENVWLHSDLLVQLLLFPMDLSYTQRSQKTTAKQARINYNIIFLDSVSHAHFLRALPNTVQSFREMKSGNQVKVFQFHMFQSLKSRTFENLQAFFAGIVDTNKTFATLAMPPSKLQINSLFHPLLEAGYSTLWLEDLCWSWEWGISKDLLVHDKKIDKATYWKKLKTAFEEAGISSFGISPSSCETMTHNRKPDPFHDMPSICMGGRYQHDYFLSYLEQYQKYQVENGQSYVSFYSCNVAHDEDGSRIQGMDSQLSAYMKAVGSQSTTLTVLMSDHGNSYGSFVEDSKQGRYETYNPMLYILMPKYLQIIIGNESIAELQKNQNRLITMLDIHHMLHYLVTKDLPTTGADRGLLSGADRGLLSPISKKRTCADLELYQPNICVCSDLDVQTPPSYLSLVAEFAAGQINNRLFEHAGGSSKAKCRVLLPKGYSTVQRNADKAGYMVTSMDIHFSHPASKTKQESVFVTVREKTTSDEPGSLMELLMYERVSLYGVYRVCGDGATTEQLCVCESGHRYAFNDAASWLHSLPEPEAHLTTIVDKLTKCLFIIRRCWDTGCSIYSGNSCTTGAHTFHFKLISSHVQSSSRDLSVSLTQGDIKFALVTSNDGKHNFSNSFNFFKVYNVSVS